MGQFILLIIKQYLANLKVFITFRDGELNMVEKLKFIKNISNYDKKKLLIISLYILALIMIVISYYKLFITIPNLEENISKKEINKAIILQNQEYYQSLLQSTTIMINQWNTLKEINGSSNEFESIEISLSMFLKQMLVYEHLSLYGKPAENIIEQNWNIMSVNELVNEHARLLPKPENQTAGIYSLEDIQKSITELKKDKEMELYSSVMFNIIGVLLTHTAIILSVVFNKFNQNEEK
jgi:hypothetical protein